MKKMKPPHLSPSDLRLVKELLRAEIRPLVQEVKKMRNTLKKQQSTNDTLC